MFKHTTKNILSLSVLGQIFIAATKQLYEWFSPSVRLSVTRFFVYVLIIVSSWNFQELLAMTEVASLQKVRGQRSR